MHVLTGTLARPKVDFKVRLNGALTNNSVDAPADIVATQGGISETVYNCRRLSLDTQQIGAGGGPASTARS